MLLNEIFSVIKEAAPAIGRRYQHIEDLVFTNGSNGGLHAVERLKHMGSKGGTIELKWDGSPVVYWGRDEQGRFSLIPKNAWDYLKRGKTQLDNGTPTVMYQPKDIKDFLLNTGKADTAKDKARQAFAKQTAALWPYFEKISPEQGYLEGGLLFYPGTKPDGGSAEAVYNTNTGEYEFQPNITQFHIPGNSELGNRIKSAKVMVAATGFYPALGSSEEGRYPNAEGLSTPDVIVQGTTYVENAPGHDEAGLNDVAKFISSNAQAIDNFLSPKPGLSKPGDILYKFFNQNLRVAGVKKKFQEWAAQNLSAGQAAKVINDPGLDVVLTAVEMLTKQKMNIIDSLSKGTHRDIRQTKPEGYVQAHPGGKFANDIPGQFVKAIDQANWAPRKD
jgi:Family of unknown function (DUF6267)